MAADQAMVLNRCICREKIIVLNSDRGRQVTSAYNQVASPQLNIRSDICRYIDNVCKWNSFTCEALKNLSPFVIILDNGTYYSIKLVCCPQFFNDIHGPQYFNSHHLLIMEALIAIQYDLGSLVAKSG